MVSRRLLFRTSALFLLGLLAFLDELTYALAAFVSDFRVKLGAAFIAYGFTSFSPSLFHRHLALFLFLLCHDNPLLSRRHARIELGSDVHSSRVTTRAPSSRKHAWGGRLGMSSGSWAHGGRMDTFFLAAHEQIGRFRPMLLDVTWVKKSAGIARLRNLCASASVGFANGRGAATLTDQLLITFAAKRLTCLPCHAMTVPCPRRGFSLKSKCVGGFF